MNVCIETKILIDEADVPPALPFEAARHIEVCTDCKTFADERARLRGLISSAAHIMVPVNFDAILRERLQERIAQGSFRWLRSPVYVRLGAATAALAVAILAGQQAGLFNKTSPALDSAMTEPTAVTVPNTTGSENTTAVIAGAADAQPDPKDVVAVVSGSHKVRALRAVKARVPTDIDTDGLVFDNVGVRVLVLGKNGERRLRIPAVSAGAQLQLYVNSNRPRPQPSPAQISF
jgi:hypothetical protein